ncbi:MAG: hypothetical protein IGBAC_0140 [Ignavibacteriae bacterium]|nr:MAG: hypothetical protein IGBAC_0140 [Ignavibacteriota bacterium]
MDLSVEIINPNAKKIISSWSEFQIVIIFGYIKRFWECIAN